MGTQSDDGSMVIRGGVDSALPLGCTIINRSGSRFITSSDTKKSGRSAGIVGNSSNNIVRSKLATEGLGKVDGRASSTSNPTNAATARPVAGSAAEGTNIEVARRNKEEAGEVQVAAVGSERLHGEMLAAVAAKNLNAKGDEQAGIRPKIDAGLVSPSPQSQLTAPAREPIAVRAHTVEQAAQYGDAVAATAQQDRGASSKKGFRQALAAASSLLNPFSTRNNRNNGTGSLESETVQSANLPPPPYEPLEAATRSAGPTTEIQPSLSSNSIPPSMEAVRERERLWGGGEGAVPSVLVQREDAARMAPLAADRRGTDRRVADRRTASLNRVDKQTRTPSTIEGQVARERVEAHPGSLERGGKGENGYTRRTKIKASSTRSILVASTTSRVAAAKSREDRRVTLGLRRAVRQLALSSARHGKDTWSGVYNPGPTFQTSETCAGGTRRGRKKKMLLDASLITSQDTVEEGKVLALVADPEIHQVRW